jgi:hypothetical protein
MRILLPKKEKYYKQFADSLNRVYRQMRYGIDSCRPDLDADLIDMRKQIVDWQAIEDEGALCQTNINYTTWLPISYRNDTSVQYDMSNDVWGPGYYKSSSADAPQQVGVGYAYGDGTQNIIEVNTGGCITRINLNPAITINQNSSFVFTQQTPATMWDVVHGMNLIPNVRIEDLTGVDIQGVIDIVDNNRLKIYFNQPVAGRAYLS